MNLLTPAQIKVIQTWTEQRDALHREIGIASTEFENLQKSTKEEGLALADLHKSIAESRGRLAELTALETRYRNSTANDIAQLEVRKATLEGLCATFEERAKKDNDAHHFITSEIEGLGAVHITMKEQAAIVNKVVGEIIKTSQTHTSDMKVMMDNIKTVSDGVVEKANENIKQTGIIIDKLPKFIFDIQKPIPVRRTYPKGHPNAPKEE